MFQTVFRVSRPLVLIALVLFAILSSASELFAQGLGVTIAPATIDERVDPGGSLTGALTVTNVSNERETYVIGTRNVTGMEAKGTPLFERGPSADPLASASWIKLEVTMLELGPGESGQVPYRIEVPVDAEPGGHFAAFFITREADTVLESGAGVGFHVASLANLRVSGEVVEDIVFKEFSTGKLLYTKPPVDFSVRFENTGNVHERPQGIITLTDLLGNEVSQLPVNENAGAILPRAERLFAEVWEHEGFLLGRYQARASVMFGDREKKTITRETTFWVVPLREVGVVLGSILGLVLLLALVVRAYVRRILRSAGADTARTSAARARASFAQRLLRTTLWFAALVALGVISLIVFFA